ncbi:hypothetical protein, partial [uncultured Nostoc sp.]|uniref:hypothetical protein n=1 Tax=uncultured Nostoc sp. TaxID=340711 RepID=UPI0035C9ED1E
PIVSFQVTLVAFATPIVSSAVARRPQSSSLHLCVSLFSNANHDNSQKACHNQHINQYPVFQPCKHKANNDY